MLADEQVDLVYIAVPHAFHYPYAKMCLEAGKNIIVEKPFTANRKEAKEIIKMAEEKKLLAVEVFWMRYLPMAATLKELCDSDIIGRIQMFSGEIGYHLTQQRLFVSELGGGALLDVGVYLLALAGMIFGYDVEGIHSDAALTSRGVDERNSFILRYRNGQMAALSSSMVYMSDGRGTVWGEKGYLEIQNTNRLERITVWGPGKKMIACYDAPECKNRYEYELQSVVEALREGRIDAKEIPHGEIVKRLEIMDTLRRQWNMSFPFET